MTTDRARVRAERALGEVDLTGHGLEIGPSYDPLVPKSSGANVEVVDHATQSELIAKYRTYGLDQSQSNAIEPVDHVWTEGSLRDALPDGVRYDYIVAAHVLEHQVDLVQFLQDCQALLHDDGRLALIVPDKRLCFDRFRPVSTVGDVLQTHAVPPRFHTMAPLIDHQLYATQNADGVAWPTLLPDDELRMQFRLPDGIAAAVRDGLGQQHYRDTHRWIFTPTSLSLLLSDLAALGYHGLHPLTPVRSHGFEMFLTLGPDAEAPAPDRLQKLIDIEHELAENLTARPPGDAPSALERSLTTRCQLLTDIEALQRQLTAHEDAINDLTTSRSWRITAPIRALSSLRRRRPT